MKLSVKLKNKAEGISFSDLVLQLSYFRKATGGVIIPETVMHRPQTTGDVTHDFGQDLVLDRDIFIVLILGSTSVLAQRVIRPEEIDENEPVMLEFDFQPVQLKEPGQVSTPKPLFAYGRLLEKQGRNKMEDIQIIFEATVPGEDSPRPIASVRTEANGYFFIEYPGGHFLNASARIGLDIVQNPIPIKLDPSSEPELMIFPKHIIIVVDLGDQTHAAEECDCGCKTLDVHEPKRVLEEYSFYSVVRTTEPEIQGYILNDEKDITLEDVLIDHPLRSDEITNAVMGLSAFKNLGASRTIAFSARGATSSPDDEVSKALKAVRINHRVLKTFLNREGGITKDNIVELINRNETQRFREKVEQVEPKPLGRVVLNSLNSIDWDIEPTIYQSVSVAHGHLLHYKAEWIADGYSLGDLLYSLPLAPGQKKQIVVFDWERRESATNLQSIEYEESLYNSLARDRDVYEITKGSIQEKMSGKSSATTASASAGIGGFVGGVLFGVSGGVGHSGSSASQTSLKQTSASDLQKIRDRTVQSANAVRSQRTSVIQTVSQGERFEVSSETVANYNHCHAITIQYFEVLRHFKVRHRFVDARECLFVPFIISTFDLDKLLRWREALQAALINDKLIKGFDAAERVKSEWADSNFPAGTFASETILNASGNFQIRFIIRRPDDKLVETDDHSKPIYSSDGQGNVVGYQKKIVVDINEDNWASLIPFIGATTPRDFYDHHLRNAPNKDEVFHRLLGEKIATSFVNALTFHVADETGNEISSMNFDASLNSRYRKEGILNISVRFMGPSQFGRDKLHYIKIRCGTPNILPDFSNVTVESGFIRYKTNHYEGFLCRYQSIKDDLSASDGVTLFAGPSNDELRDPRKDDIAIVNKLISHLNDNLEYYNGAALQSMSAERRFMLLDGIILPGPKGLGRSLASLVENSLIGIVGNSMVFPVAQGLNLDPNFGLSDSLTDYYMVSADDPISVSIPTKGVYAESMMGQCNSCEEKDESRFWRWEESPIPDSPTAIAPITTESRRTDPGNLQPAQLPAPMVNIQNAPALPDPSGLAGTLSLLGKGDVFRDITGLDENQKNALGALKASFETTKAFGQEAAKIEMKRMEEAAKIETQKIMDRRLDSALNKIKNSGLPPAKQAELTEKAINAYLGAGAKQEDKPKDNKEKVEDAKAKTEAIKDAVKSGAISPKTGEHLVAASLQHEFAASKEITPGVIDAQELLSNPAMADKDIEFVNDSFKVAAKSPLGQAGGGSGGATPLQNLVNFVIINKYRERDPAWRVWSTDPVNGVAVRIKGASGSILQDVNADGNRIRMDLGFFEEDGPLTIDVLPVNEYTDVPITDLGDPTNTPPDRLWLPYTTTIDKQGNTITSSDPRVTIQNNDITIRLQPKWMLIGRNAPRGNHVPELIVVHHTDTFNHNSPPYDPNFHSFINKDIQAWIGGDRTAPHYVIDRDGFVIKLCHESRRCNHVGFGIWDGWPAGEANARTIGIEVVHTNNQRPNNGGLTYTEEYTQEQYDALVELLRNLTQAYNIPAYNIIGHSDIAITSPHDPVVGRKSSDPGRMFDWTVLEGEGLGLQRSEGPIDWNAVFGGFFVTHQNGRIRDGEPGVTPAIVHELKADLTRIGYNVSAGDVFDRSVSRAIMVFCEHFMSLDHQDSVSQEIADQIKRIVMYLATVKP